MKTMASKKQHMQCSITTAKAHFPMKVFLNNFNKLKVLKLP